MIRTPAATVLRGDARCLPLPDASVDLVVTSPPYFGLRSYTDGGEHYGGQVGSEATPAEYVAALTECTRDWVRVLKPSGSIFVNLGDKYAGSIIGGQTTSGLKEGTRYTVANVASRKVDVDFAGARPKSLLGLPWRYALAVTDQLGLILRAEIIWAKPNGLPESVTDRVRRAHEQVFHFTRLPRYYSAVDEIREPHIIGNGGRQRAAARGEWYERKDYHDGARLGLSDERALHPLGKLPGSVWDIASQPLTVPPQLGVDHFASFPMELPRRIILGWSPPGVCTACGEGRRPVPAAVALDMSRPQARRAQQIADRAGLTEGHLAALLSVGVSDTGRGAATQNGTGHNTPEVYALADEARSVLGGYAREYLLRRPVRFGYACACPQPDAPTCPALVVDPFGGTGTTALVAAAYGRHGITIDMSADYCRLAAWRTTDPAQRAAAMQVPKPPPVIEGQATLDLFGATPEQVTA